ncbi:MAG: UDP-N-acetylglucosamine 2-epimerase (non-hydrolyzing) [Bacteroidetes bacterium]|nr:UDP-N-acetylglucosamine 2-epimerase (non-hydrolyzing) [Bacteroidota bacterium]MCY4205025.1 UDP-N-acetylglucosamine 2-epimerase (non-hydrolyzing) [Bacteroidota bacterium]
MHVCTLVGARPQFIKAAAVSPALKEAGIKETLVHSGQHYDKLLSQVFFDELGVPAPVVNLETGSGSHATQTGYIMVRLEKFINETGPYDAVIVYGDTNTTLAGALVAAKGNIPLAHVESGMRSFNQLMPEEINRIVTDRLSKWLFAPTEIATQNLKQEGLEENTILVGDVMLDATHMFVERAQELYPLESVTRHHPREYFLSTIHRPSNTDNEENLRGIFDAFGQLPLPVVLPLHPRTKAVLTGITIPDNVEVTRPASYLEMLTLTLNANRVITDSGGLQKEAYWFGVPCIILREETEYPEMFKNNWSICTGANEQSIVSATIVKPSGPQCRLGEGPEGYASAMIARSLAG